MAQYFFSQNRTINNFGTDTNQVDRFFVDVGSASSLNIFQSGTDVVVTNGVNTTRFTNLTLSQFASFALNPDQTIGGAIGQPSISVNDGTVIRIGTNNPDVITGAGTNLPLFAGLGFATGTTTVGGGDFVLGLGDADTISSNGGADFINGNAGNDTITLDADDPANSGNLSRAATVFGGQGNDTITAVAASRPSLLFGNLGDDTITFGSGVASSASTVFGGQGNDVLNGAASTANDLVYGDLGNDSITGGAGNDTLFGGDGFDTVRGGAGSDLIFGNQGDDQLFGNGGNDTLFGGQGQDVLDGGAGADLLLGNMGDDTVISGAGADTVFGGQGDDFLDARTNATGVRLNGDLGNDFLFGGTGTDTMTGGQGNDVFNTSIAGSGVTQATADVVTDFGNGNDLVNFTDVPVGGSYTEFQGLLNGNVVSTVDQAVQAYAQSNVPFTTYTFIAGATDGYLVVDTNLDGVAESVLRLQGANNLGAFDSANLVN